MGQRRLENLDLNLLLSLHWLLTDCSVTAAASHLGTSQPAASRALAKLRQTFDDPLLVKSGGRMVLTPLGRDLKPLVARAIEGCRDVLRLSEPFDPLSEDSRFRIACTDYIGATMAAAWAQAVRPLAPQLALDLVAPTYDSPGEMMSGRLDICILPDLTLLKLPPNVPVDDFVRTPIMDHRYMTAVRKGHRLDGQRMTLDEFLAHDHILVAPEGTPRGIIDEILAMRGLSRRIAYTASSFLLALPILKRTDSILTGPEPLLRLLADSFWITDPPVPTPQIEWFAIWHPNWTQSARHRFVRNALFPAVRGAAAQTAQK